MVRRAPAPIGAAEAARLTRLSGPRKPLALPGGRMLEDGACGRLAGALWCRLGVGLDGAAAALWFPWPVIEVALGALVGWRDAEDDLEVVASLLELALDDELRALAALGIDASLDDLSRHDAPTVPAPSCRDASGQRALTLVAAGQRWPLLLEAADAVLDTVLARWPVAPAPADEVPLGATLRLGSTTLAAGVLRSLEPGDAVLPQTGLATAHGRAAGCLVVAGDRLAPARWDGQRWVLERAPGRAHADREGWLGMVDPVANGTGEAAEAGEDDIPLRLCFDLGRLEMKLGELRRLGPGAVLELPGPGAGTVALTVGGRRVGEGELVEVDGRAAVRVLRILGRG